MKNIVKSSLIIITAFVLAACQSTEKFQFKNQNFQITEVEVNLPASIDTKNKLLKPTEDFHSYMTNAYANYLAEYNAMRPNANTAYKLRVDVSNVHYKNVVQSLLIGDANRIEATASVIDPNSGAIVHSAPANYLDDASGALNGITGAVLSVLVKRQAAEANMAKGSAKNTMKFLFPSLKLSKGAEQRLKAKNAIQPRTTAISSLSAPVLKPVLNTSQVQTGTVYNATGASVVKLNQ